MSVVLALQQPMKYVIVIACNQARDTHNKHWSGYVNPPPHRVARSCVENARALQRLRKRSSGRHQRSRPLAIENSMQRSSSWVHVSTNCCKGNNRRRTTSAPRPVNPTAGDAR